MANFAAPDFCKKINLMEIPLQIIFPIFIRKGDADRKRSDNGPADENCKEK